MKNHKKKKQQQQQAFVPQLRQIQSQQSKALRKSERYKAAQMKLVESQDDCIEDYFVKKNLRRGIKCWRKYQRQYFKDITLSSIIDWKQNTTTNQILQFLSNLQEVPKSNSTQQNNFIISLYKNNFPDVLDENYIRVLFEKSQNLMMRRQSQVQQIIREMQNPNDILMSIEQQLQYNCFNDKQYTLASFEINSIAIQQQAQQQRQSNDFEPIKIQQYSLHDSSIQLQQQMMYQIIRNHGHMFERDIDFGKNNTFQQFSEQIPLCNLDIKFRGCTSDAELINKIFEYQRLVETQPNQIQRQLICWQRQLQAINQQNNSLWQKASKNFEIENYHYQNLKKFYTQNCEMQCESEVGNSNTTLNSINSTVKQSHQSIYKAKQDQTVDNLQKYLFYSQILKYFQKGYSDKHNSMLQEIKELIEINKVLASSQNPLKRHSSQSFDKNQHDIFEEPQLNKQKKDFNLRYQFESDCKICFCTENLDINKVLYCEGCNTSFHQSCYGIKNLNLRKDEQFYCDSCLYLKLLELDYSPPQLDEQESYSKTQQREEKLNEFLRFSLDNRNTQFYEQKIRLLPKSKPHGYRKIVCKVCFQADFPLKNLDGHFYHVNCLILFNLAQIKDYKIQLKPNQSYETIAQKVIDNQLQNNFCQFCSQSPSCNKGMQFKCNWKGCCKTFHPICAYMNGCKFQIEKKNHILNISVSCFKHYGRDNANQVYLRRFFCDYQKTSQLLEDEFHEIYLMEQQERRICVTKRTQKQIHKEKQIEQISKKTKIGELYMLKYIQKYIEWVNESIQRFARKNPNLSDEQIKKMMCSKISETIRYKICHPRLPFIIERVQQGKRTNYLKNTNQSGVKKQNTQEFQHAVNTFQSNIDAKSKEIIEKNQSQQTLKVPISYQNVKIEPQIKIQREILVKFGKTELKIKKCRKKQDSDYQPDSADLLIKRGRKRGNNR